MKVLLIACLVLFAVGCRSMRPLPPANLSAPGWTVRHGQAVWHLPQGEREVAGEVLLATQDGRRSFVQFTKNPFPLVNGQTTANGWEVEFPPQNKHYSGGGKPPVRVLWLYLPQALLGHALPKEMSWHSDANGWRLENKNNGESIEGYFES
ncbi:MAG TPA: hypothetical protein VLT36_19875 [Candidatus Dormibacteraeota bacterium]|nr:hypothetical protein [Candidatus Dormibacteraeota bacterium]